MHRRRFTQLTLGLGGAVLLGACSGPGEPEAAPSPRATRDVSEPAPRPSLQLASPEAGFPSPFAYGPGTHSLVLYIYDTLLVRNADGRHVNWLAASFERAGDGLTYAFEVRDGAQWHDGEPVTAEDVAFSFEYFLDHLDELPPTVLFRPDMVAGVEATSERAGEIRLDQPWVAFESEIAARFPIVPRHVWADVDEPVDVTDPDMLVGSGPYRLTELELARGSYRFEAYDDHWLGTPFVEQVEMRQVDNPLVAVRAGELDAGQPTTGSATREVLSVFTGEPEFGIVEGTPDEFVMLSWNLGDGGPPADRAFRRACAHAVDRTDLVNRVLGDGQPGQAGFLPPHHPAYHEVDDYPFDPQRAEQLLDDAGYARGEDGIRQTPDGERLRLTLLTLPELSPTAELVRDALGDVGIELEFDPTDFFTALSSGALNDYEMALLFFGGLERDADLLREIFASGTEGEQIFHALGWDNAEFDELAEQQAATLDEDERDDMLARMQELIAAELPLLPLYYATPYLVYRREAFDQWSVDVEASQIFVTGKADGEPPVRPIEGEAS